jgi:glycosyltransferase involved in cell wall biosynthesis
LVKRTMIPTEDPAAALEFCRALAARLSPSSTSMTSTTEISVILPVHNELANIAPLFQRLVASLQELTLSFEIVFVDDGSNDGSTEQIINLANQYPFVVAIIFSRNFGHQAAVVAGLDNSKGRGIVIMDSDLQDEPEIIPALYERWKAGFDVVYAIRKTRAESAMLRLCYALFYRILKGLAIVDIPLDAGDFSLIDRKVLNAINSVRERNPFVRGIRSWVGFTQCGVPVERQARNGGSSKYGFRALTSLALDGLIGFSLVPLRCITWIGGMFSLTSLTLGLFYFMKKISVGLYPPGFATLTVLILFVAGVQFLTLGIISEYLGRVFDEVKARPRYVVGKRIN